MKGILITFEGIDGVGKSTQIRLLNKRIAQKGIETILTREPGGTKISEQIREMLLDNANTEMDAMTEVLLYAAARAQIVQEVIAPALEAGKAVICDRYIHSSIAYQGFGREVGEKTVWEINRHAVRGIMPDATFLLVMSPDGAEKRRSRKADRIESMGKTFQQKVQQGFLQMQENRNVFPIQADRPVEEIEQEIWNIIVPLLNKQYQLKG